MKPIFSGLLLSMTFIVSCSKNDTLNSNILVGSWTFTNQAINSFAYPSVLNNNPFPVGTSTMSIAIDSIKLTFDNAGNYTFSNFHLPVDKGKYTIVQDSLLVIKPDTSDFVKFNYTLQSVTFVSGIPPVPIYSPYSSFHFSTDTIRFKLTNNNIIFSGVWVTKANHPIIPSNDTLLLNQSLNYFKR